MKQVELMNNFSRTFGKVGFKLKKHSPEILIAAGVVGTVVSAVLACRATTKVSEILEKTKSDVAQINDCLADESLAETYTQEDGKKDLAIVYTQTGLKLVKLYAPAVLLGALSLTSIIASNRILQKRNAALAAAYATVDAGFKAYRSRVVERFGEELDRELKYNLKSQVVEETVVDEKGKEKKVEQVITVAEPHLSNPYSKFYDVGCEGWEKDPEHNLYFLLAQQQFANDKLKAQGYLFLNDVYEMLGILKTRPGQVVGWIYDPDNPDHKGDNYVDFGIYNAHSEAARRFVNGYERTILLDFNVDGYILDQM